MARCRGWMERQSSLLDEFFLFSRRSFKNGRLACKSARATWSLGFISITFFHPRTHEATRVTLLVSVGIAFTRVRSSSVAWEFEFSFDRSRRRRLKFFPVTLS